MPNQRNLVALLAAAVISLHKEVGSKDISDGGLQYLLYPGLGLPCTGQLGELLGHAPQLGP